MVLGRLPLNWDLAVIWLCAVALGGYVLVRALISFGEKSGALFSARKKDAAESIGCDFLRGKFSAEEVFGQFNVIHPQSYSRSFEDVFVIKLDGNAKLFLGDYNYTKWSGTGEHDCNSQTIGLVHHCPFDLGDVVFDSRKRFFSKTRKNEEAFSPEIIGILECRRWIVETQGASFLVYAPNRMLRPEEYGSAVDDIRKLFSIFEEERGKGAAANRVRNRDIGE